MARYGRTYIRPIIILGSAAKGTRLSANASITVQGQHVSPTGTVPLSLYGKAQAISKPSLTATVTLAIKSISDNVMRSSVIANLALTVKTVSENFARSTAPTGKATLFGRAFSAILGRPFPSGTVGLSSHGESISTIRGPILNIINIFGKSLSRSTALLQASLSAAINLRSSTATVGREIITGKAAVNIRSAIKASAFANSSGVVSLLARSLSDSFAQSKQFANALFLITRGFSRLSVALSNGQYNLAMNTRASGDAQARSSASGKVILASLAKVVAIGRSGIGGSANLVSRSVSISKSSTISAVGFLLRAASFATTKTKATANYMLALTSKTLARSAATGLPPSSMRLALRAYSALVAASIAQTNSFQHRIQLFANSIAAVVGTWANRVANVPGQFVSGARGNSVTGTGGSTAVSGQSDSTVNGSGGADSVSGSGP